MLVVLKELARAAKLPQLVQDLPEDVTPVDVAQSLVELNRLTFATTRRLKPGLSLIPDRLAL